ncbi:lipopolysaccharide biosynthesis protein [Photobacterium leiognathi]|uniref:lipopolysaccharide biosynthesis protein n=1 Tax=Photobacterium leiognathi TaxID=553611 RepID=UPI0029813599|nr:hypothetical protein [Photobacterium leiognathi]
MLNINRKSKIFFVIGSGGSGMLSLLLIPMLTWFYDVKQIGAYAIFVASIGLISSVGSLALEQSFIRYYYIDEKDALISKFFKISTIIFVFVFVISLFFWKDISIFISSQISWISFSLLMLSSCITIASKYTSIILRMEGESLFFAIGQVLNRMLLILFVILSVNDYFNIIKTLNGLFAIHTLGLLLSFIYQVVEIRRYNIIRLISVSLTKEWIINKLKYAIPLLFSVLIIWGMSSIDKYTLKFYYGNYELGLYSNAFKFSAALILFQQLISTIWIPTSMRWFSIGKPLDVYKVLYTFVMGGVTVIYGICIILTPYISLIINKDFIASIAFIPILMLYPVFYIASEFTTVGILFKEKTKFSLYTSLITVVIFLTTCFYLTKVYGVYGTSFSVVISYIGFFVCRTLFSAYSWENIVTNKSIAYIFICFTFTYLYYFNDNVEYKILLILFTCSLLVLDFIKYKRVIK